ncbi:MAG TPA: hypothetical protein VLJ15_00640 [Gammaproteobacteria bacterium]|nr:hypothetical protein [Gammaproteobacteria bacterium]
MTSQRQKKAGFPLPDPVLGWPLMDVCLKIPDAPEYRRAFVGHLYALGLWASWEKSYLPGDTRAKEAGQLWRDVLNQYLDMGCEMSCCCPEPNGTRFNADGSSSVTYDGGATWVPNPDDPRTNAPQLPPPTTPPGADTKCKAANNALQQIKDAQSEFSNNLESGKNLLQLGLAIAGVIALVFFTSGAAAFLVPIVLELAAGILTITKADYDALFTSGVWDYVLCTLYCNVGEDGTFSQSNFNNILAKFDTHFSGNLALTFSSTLEGWQLVGLNNAARIPSTSNLDCSGCDCAGCASHWELETAYFGGGTIVTRDADSITVASTYVGGTRQAIAITTGNADICCTCANIEVVAGTYTDFTPHILCGSAIAPGNLSPGFANGQCVNTVIAFLDTNAAFTLKFTFTDC